MVELDELTISEGGSIPEYVVIRLNVEDILELALVLVLNALLDDKGHEAERQRQVLLEDQPVVVLAIQPMALVDQGAVFIPFVLVCYLLEVLKVKSFDCALLRGEDDFVLRDDVWVAR